MLQFPSVGWALLPQLAQGSGVNYSDEEEQKTDWRRVSMLTEKIPTCRLKTLVPLTHQ